MKSILLSIRPEWVAKILNGEKTIEVRKQFPKDYVGWVYIYCTKGKGKWLIGSNDDKVCSILKLPIDAITNPPIETLAGNGKVVARFWCDKVEEILIKDSGNIYTNTLSNNKLLTKSCLADNEIKNYLSGNWHKKYNYWFGGYAVHISKLEIFDEPKELNEFIYYKCSTKDKICKKYCIGCGKKLIHKASQNYCYIEGEEK